MLLFYLYLHTSIKFHLQSKYLTKVVYLYLFTQYRNIVISNKRFNKKYSFKL